MKKIFDFICSYKLIRKFLYFLILYKIPYLSYLLKDRVLSRTPKKELNNILSKIQKSHTKKLFKGYMKEAFEYKNQDYISKIIEKNLDAHFIAVGSCTGREIFYFVKKYPSLNYISTDIEVKFLEFQKKKYGSLISFDLLDIRNIDEFIKSRKIINDKKIILISGIFMYLTNEELKNVISKFLEIKNVFFILDHTIQKQTLTKDLKRVDFFDHDISKILAKSPLKKIFEIEKKVKQNTYNHFGIYKN